MRTPRPTLVLLLCVLIPASSLHAQQLTTPAPPVASDPQAVALLQKSLAAMTGGIAVTDVTLTGTASRIAGSDDETGTATLRAAAAGDSRVDLSFPSGERVEIRNHFALPLPEGLPPGAPSSAATVQQPAGAWSGPDGVRHGMSAHNVMTDATWFFPAITLANILKDPGYVVSYVGPETLDGTSVIHLRISEPLPASVNAPVNIAELAQHLSQMDLYLDPETSLPIVLNFDTHPDNNAAIDIAVEIQFSNYQRVSGVQAPFHVQKYLNNALVLDLQSSEALLNSGLPSSVFQIQ